MQEGTKGEEGGGRDISYSSFSSQDSMHNMTHDDEEEEIRKEAKKGTSFALLLFSLPPSRLFGVWDGEDETPCVFGICRRNSTHMCGRRKDSLPCWGWMRGR